VFVRVAPAKRDGRAWLWQRFGTGDHASQFAARSNAICDHLDREQARVVTWLEDAVVSRRADSGVAALPRPVAQAKTIAQLVEGNFGEAAYEEAAGRAIQAGDRVEADAQLRRFIALARYDAHVARGLGMTECAKAEAGDRGPPGPPI
jgi:hypothetical protein